MQDIKPLLVFAHLLQHGSMQATGKALGMSASAVSQHISRLEQLHKVKLLNRGTRSIVPTEVGRELGVYCNKLLQALNDTTTALENIKTEAFGEVHIALTSGLVNNPSFQHALADLFTHHPAIQIQLHFSDQLVDLQDGGIDIAIRGGERSLSDPNVIAHHLTQGQMGIFASSSYLQHHPIQQPADLLAQRWFCFQPINYLLQNGAESFHLRIENALQCDQILAQQSFVEQGLGLGIALDLEFASQMANGKVQQILPEWKLPCIDIYAVTPYRVQSAKVDCVLKTLKQYFAQAK